MISIIVPVYKVESYLSKCIESIIEQTYSDIEIVLVDDGSPDHCGVICDDYSKQDCRVKVLHTENGGLSAARNAGLRIAQGDYVGFVDSDDWIQPDMYKSIIDRMILFNADVGFCGISYDSNTAVMKTLPMPDACYSDKEVLEAFIDGRINSIVCNKLYRRSVFDDIVFPPGRYYEDISVMHKVIGKCQTAVSVNTIGYHYLQREGSITREHSARYLVDKVKGTLERYNYFKDEHQETFSNMHERILRIVAESICALWRWWYSCDKEEKKSYAEEIDSFHSFVNKNFPLFGYKSWPIYLRFSSIFMHSKLPISFALIYELNQVYRILFPKNSNLV